MQIRDAFTRALRTAAAVFVAGVTIVHPAATVVGIKEGALAQATSFAAAGIYAVASGIVTFVNCFAEDNTRYQLPK